MTRIALRKITLVALACGAMALSACTTEKAIDNTVGVAAGATKLVAKGAVGAGKLAYKGGKKIIGADSDK